jgi:hypothetical protein
MLRVDSRGGTLPSQMGFFNKLLGRPDKNDFAQMMVKLLREAGEQRPIEYDQHEFLLRLGAETRVHLGNLYADYLAASRKDRVELLAKLARLTQPAQEMELSYPSAKDKLLPRVRERFYHEAVRLDAIYHGAKENEFKPMPTRLLNEHLTVEVVIDMPDRVGIVSQEQLNEWRVTFDDALALGRENLWKLSTKSFQQLGRGLYLSNVGDTHDASRMFLHDLVWQHEVKGRHVVITPNRNVLLVSGSEEEEGLAKMIEMAEEVMQQPRAQTGMAFELHDATWKPFFPPPQSPIYHRFRNLAIQSTARDYGEQKKLLDKIFEKRGKDIYIGEPIYFRKKDGSLFSMGTWARGVETLLAETEFVAFGVADINGKPRSLGYAPWDRVHEVARQLLHQSKDYPPRYHVVDFPSPEQLRTMDLVPMPS